MAKVYHWILEEIIYLVVLALPAAIECLTEGLQIKMSNVFIGRASGNRIDLMLSALFMGQTVNIMTAYPIAEGFGVYVNVLCSQAYGAKQYKLVGLYFYRALFMAALTCFPVFTVFISVRPIVYLLFQDWELAQYTGSFTDVLCFGYPAYLYYKIGFRFLQALNIVWGPVLYFIIGNILNGVIQYILIFRYNTTLAGAAAGYVISNYLVALLVFTHIQLSHVHTLIAHKWTIEYITNWLHTARYAVVPTIQFVITSIPAVLYPVVFIYVMSNDSRQLAIYSILHSIAWVSTLSTMGLSSCIAVRVGILLGSNEPKKARNASLVGIFFGKLVLGVFNLILFLLSEQLSLLFTTDIEFARTLCWNIKIITILQNNYIIYVVQGVMNACNKQGIQMVFKFILQILVGSVATGILVYFVTWKAIAIFVPVSVGNLLYYFIAMYLLFRGNWSTISLSMSKRTNARTEIRDIGSGEFREKVSVLSSTLALLRYISCVIVSICVFILVLGNCFKLYH